MIKKIILFLLGSLFFGSLAYALDTLTVPQGGTDAGSFSSNSVIVSGTTTTGALSASSTPSLFRLIATSTAASSSIVYGLEVATGNLRIGGLVSCNTIDTDANGYFTCGTDTGGSSFAWTPTTWGGVLANSTTTLIQFLAGSVSATSSIGTLTVGTFTATSTGATTTALNASGQVDFDTLTSALVLSGSTGLLEEYTGIDCTNQFVRDVSAAGAGTCATVTSSDVDTTIVPSTRTLTVAGTANQITSSAGAQDLSANRTWTLSLPAHVIFPSSFQASSATTTYSTSTVAFVSNKLSIVSASTTDTGNANLFVDGNVRVVSSLYIGEGGNLKIEMVNNNLSINNDTSSGEFNTTPDGTFGFGTSTPSNYFSVHGNSYISGTSFFGGAIRGTSTLTVDGLSTLTGGYISSASSTVLGTLLVTNGGSIGVGTTSPDVALAVTGNIYATGGLGIGERTALQGGMFFTRVGNDPFFVWTEGTTRIGQIRADSTDSIIYFSSVDGSQKYFNVITTGTNAGNVGVGSTTTAFDLAVGVSGINSGQTSFTNTSRRSAKQNISTSTYPTDLLDQFEKVKIYNWQYTPEFLARTYGTTTEDTKVIEQATEIHRGLMAEDFSKLTGIAQTGVSGDERMNIMHEAIGQLTTRLKALEVPPLGKINNGGRLEIINAKEVHTELLCVGKTCVTEQQLKDLLETQRKSNWLFKLLKWQ